MRAVVQRAARPWRTVMTNFVADEHVDLAGLDGVVLVDVPERLEHEEQRVVVALELGTLVGGERVLDGQRVQVVDLLDRRRARRSSGSCRPTQTKSSRRSPWRVRRPGRGLGAVDVDPFAVAVQRVVHDHAQASVHRDDAARLRRRVRSRHGNRDPGPARTHGGERRPASSPGAPRASTSTTPARAQAARAADRLAGLPLAAVVTSPLERCRETAKLLARRAPVRAARRPRAHRVRLRRVDRPASSRSWPRRRCGGPSRPTRPARRSPAASRWPEMSARAVAAVRDRDAAVAAEHGDDAVWLAVSPRRRDQGDPGRRARHAPRRVPADPGRPGQPLGGPLHPAPRRSCSTMNTARGIAAPTSPAPSRRKRGGDAASGDAVVGGGAGRRLPGTTP